MFKNHQNHLIATIVVSDPPIINLVEATLED